ncbi:DsbA family protein [Mycolicibacterium cosmeticum]|uniref:DsbA family protein n=1 Tax=Mycolicibacterium cosmeticum TaxID=258533 RepID=UPI00055A83DD|nr:thioredoxin domain-containing protein [Mycolicibacterium cosmeticum]
MRRWLVVLASLTLLTGVGCARQVSGAARPDPVRPMTEVSKDGFGVVAGFPEAPARIEIFTEPQCTHCADLQHDFGDAIRYYIGVGALQVTYRPMTFLDQDGNHHSERVANALFLAGAGKHTPAVAFQRFVEELWANQDPGGKGPTDDELAAMARKAGVPDEQAQQMAAGDAAVDAQAMEDMNFEFLYEIDPTGTGTPTVYDLNKDRKVDIFDDDWLKKLLDSA